MKKRILALLLMATMALSLVACGGSDNGKEVESQKEVSQATDESAKTDDSNVGEIVDEGGIRKEPIVTDKELNITGETGPIKYSLNALQLSKLTATTDEMAEILEIEKDKECAVLVIDISAENTSEETINFYLGMATATTNTKEQVESDGFLEEYMDGEFLGQVIHSGTLVYILENSNAEDITHVKLYVDAPTNENFDEVGESVEIELTFE